MEIALIVLFGFFSLSPVLWALIKKALGSKKPFMDLAREITGGQPKKNKKHK